LFSLFLTLLFLLLFGFYLLCDFFTGKGIDDSVAFHLYIGLSGIDLTNFSKLIMISALYLVAVIFVTFFVFFWKSRAIFLSGGSLFSLFIHIFVPVLLSFSILASPAYSDITHLVRDHYKQQGVSRFEEHVARFDPKSLSSKKKNLIYIYAESLEFTYFDDERFPGLTPNLGALLQHGLVISGIRQAPMTGWTISGMTASQCGIPLATFGHRNNSRSVMKSFMPGVHCIGDVLSSGGYELTYMGGADLKFGGKGQFYKDHGFDTRYGTRELEDLADRRLKKSKWGVYDDDLLRLARKKLTTLHESKKPFGLFLLTLDTHAPLGHKTPDCIEKGISYRDSDSQILNAVSCADYLLGSFIEDFLASPVHEDTILILASDHLVMRNDAGLEANEIERKNLYVVFDDDLPPRTVARDASTMDLAATTLSVMTSSDQGFALGRNLLGTQPTLIEKMGKDKFFESLHAWRKQMWSLWGAGNTTQE
tara:strand:+ start:2215 stop:3651 length:1437 start_codon:yes stop_codon:yes gene_type:complete